MSDSRKISVVFIPHYVHDALKLNDKSLEDLIPHGITELDLNKVDCKLYDDKINDIYNNLKDISKLDLLDFVIFNKGCNRLLETSKRNYSWSLLDYGLQEKSNFWIEKLNGNSIDWEDQFDNIIDELGYSDSEKKYSIVVTTKIIYVIGNKGFKTTLNDSKNMVEDILMSIEKYYGKDEALKSFAFNAYLNQ